MVTMLFPPIRVRASGMDPEQEAVDFTVPIDDADLTFDVEGITFYIRRKDLIAMSDESFSLLRHRSNSDAARQEAYTYVENFKLFLAYVHNENVCIESKHSTDMLSFSKQFDVQSLRDVWLHINRHYNLSAIQYLRFSWTQSLQRNLDKWVIRIAVPSMFVAHIVLPEWNDLPGVIMRSIVAYAVRRHGLAAIVFEFFKDMRRASRIPDWIKSALIMRFALVVLFFGLAAIALAQDEHDIEHDEGYDGEGEHEIVHEDHDDHGDEEHHEEDAGDEHVEHGEEHDSGDVHSSILNPDAGLGPSHHGHGHYYKRYHHHPHHIFRRPACRAAFHKGQCKGFADGKKAGYKAGYDQGKEEGFKIGFEDGKKLGHSNGFHEGVKEGFKAGIKVGEKKGYDHGFVLGKKEGIRIAVNRGLEKGRAEGAKIGYEEGHAIGLEKGRKWCSTMVADLRRKIYKIKCALAKRNQHHHHDGYDKKK